MNVIVELPALNPVTSPVFETVATDEFEDIQISAADGAEEAVNCVVAPTHAVNIPEIVGSGSTVTKSVAWQPLLSVKVIFEVPDATVVINPEALIVATLISAEVHGLKLAGVAVLESCNVLPIQTLEFPVITGSGLTTTFAVITHPLEFI